ncbi:MAG: hypothetical protein CL843_17585 [Crocinitomicaceae bacterium]|nr:hypothetical protein [Crocinitomicaceae bacterium]|tara:strand:+ start:355 stop:1089 length:735 start_codon:yes stop_codon:yes gene_type:complete
MRTSFTKSNNPAFNAENFENSFYTAAGESMTVSGAVNKTIILGLLMVAGAVYTWLNPSSLFMWVGLIGGLIASMVTIFKPTAAPISAPIYAVLEGMALGTVSAIYAGLFNGIIFQAVTLTIGVLFTMLFLYKTGIIKVTDKLRMGIVAATGGVFLFLMASWIMSFFGFTFFSIANASLFSIGISLVIVGIAALNLLLDFDFIDRAAYSRAPKYMEWYGAFGLMVTLVWLYLSLLRLLAMLSSRD